MQLHRRLSIGFLVVLPLLLSACFQKEPRVIPTGIQTVTGIVRPAELSLVRRGTHTLVVGGEILYYLESSTVNLGKYEGREVQMQGEVQANTDPSDIPVLEVTKITGGPSALTRTWALEDLGITIDTPSAWKAKATGTSAQFTATGSQAPILTLLLASAAQLSKTASSGSSVVKSTFFLGSHSVIRRQNHQHGRERALIDLRPAFTDPKADVLAIVFTPTEEAGVDPGACGMIRNDILHSIKFTTSSSSSSKSSTSSLPPLTGSGAGMPCGGPAGILCPQGLRWQITEGDVGRCQPF